MRTVLLRATLTITASAALAATAIGSPARGSIAPGTNGKIVFGQVFPNYGGHD
jgi:hypothetical protein